MTPRAVVHYKKKKSDPSAHCCYRPISIKTAWSSDIETVTCKKCLDQLKKERRS